MENILLVGPRKFFVKINKMLEGQFTLFHQECWSSKKIESSNIGLIISLLDESKIDTEYDITNYCINRMKSYYRIRFELQEILIGPYFNGFNKGCVKCADYRRYNNSHVKEVIPTKQTVLNSHRTDFINIDYVCGIISKKIIQYKSGEALENDLEIYHLYSNTSKLTRHKFIINEYCSICKMCFLNLPKINYSLNTNSLLRTYNISPKQQDLEELFVDDNYGIIDDVNDYYCEGSAATIARLPLEFSNEQDIGCGRESAFKLSRLVSILEGIERFAGRKNRGKEVVVSNRNDLNGESIDPSEFVLFNDNQVIESSYVKFSNELTIRWIKGMDLTLQKEVYIPEQFAYYSSINEEKFIYNSSNGCAVGGSLEEAITYAIFELIERDAFLLAWYTKKVKGIIDIKSIRDLEARNRINDIASYGYNINVLDITSEFGITAIWVLADSKSNKSLPKSFSAAAAHFDPIKALNSALKELAGFVHHGVNNWDVDRKRAKELYENPEKVSDIKDHALLYTNIEMFSSFNFIFENNLPVYDIRNVPSKNYTSINEALESILNLFEHFKLNVYFIDITCKELELANLFCVKTLIPELLPMTFGSKNFRIPEKFNKRTHLNNFVFYNNVHPFS
ncbi:YcaO-like family protein (plasmid) [Sutcliffiella horikoshii]|uniref:YcaO-like family protein n=1 Tax=Sutcliffiella horikoshii TaxID=79883 RepID=UPI001CBC7765|nr:YcaO-like family protein [Sutcliffiella horikoshii]UAL49793.1 YcaO-like family protein [Sutcliffiella horikoshii]